MKNQRGAAMVIVMALVVFLGLLAVSHQYQTKQMQIRTQMVVDRVAAKVAVRSIEAEVDFAMLTNSWVGEGSDPEESIYVDGTKIGLPKFDGSEVKLDNASLRVQDESGLMPLSMSSIKDGFVGALLDQVSLSDPRNAKSYQQMKTELSMGTERKSQAPEVVELATLFSIGTIERNALNRVGSFLTNAPITHFNPLTAPTDVLKARLLPDEARVVIALRNRGELGRDTMWRVIDIDKYEGFSLFPGPFFTVEIEARHGKARVVSRRVVGYRPHGLEPVAIWNQHKSFPVRVK